jgi:hypothetical protein
MLGIVRVRVAMNSAPISDPVSENRPPASEVPPMTTARIASSSIHRPRLLAFTELVLAAMTRPAMPEQRPENA